MRIFVAGATGVIGVPLVTLLVEAGHDVAAMSRSGERAKHIAAMGAEPVVCDVFDADGLTRVVTTFSPDTVVHQLTDLPNDAALLPAMRGANARIRREGTRNLLTAGRAAGATRFLAQSVAWELTGEGLAAQDYLEKAVLAVRGTVLRYGRFYGPGTYYEREPPPPPRIHIDEAAQRTLYALEAPSGVILVVER